MKYCEKCKVKVDTDLRKCPLCSAVLAEGEGLSYAEHGEPEQAVDDKVTEAAAESETGGSPDESTPEPESGDRPDEAAGSETSGAPRPRHSKYPAAAAATDNKYNFVLRLFLFISVVIASTCLLINILTFSGVLWSAYVAGTLFYVWITVAYPIFTKKKLGQIIVINTIATAIYVYSLELGTRTKGWGLTYVTPFLFIASTLFITFVILLKRLKWREYAVYQTVMVIMGFLPVIFCAVGLVTAIWPSIFSAFYSFLTVIGMFIFGDKKYKDELIKRFHL